MNRLHKRCFVASAGVHLLLLVILFVGPAFFSQKNKMSDVTTVTFYPDLLIDSDFAGGGHPNPKPPPVTRLAPPQLQVAVSVPQPQQPSPKDAQEANTSRSVSDSLEMARDRKQHKVEVNTTLVRRKPNSKTQDKPVSTDSAAKAQEQQQADNRQRLARQLTRAAANIQDGISSAVTVEDFGQSAGGPAYASYAAWVKTVYEDAWVVPDDAANDDAIAKATVTIARDGTIISAQLTKKSGDAQMDASVQRAIERVTTIGRAFPDGSKDKQRTYVIPFNLKAKRGLA